MPATKAGNGKWMQWALGLSLGVNLLVVGVVAGAAYRFDGPHSGPSGTMRNFGTPYIVALEKDRRREVFKQLRQTRTDGPMTREARRALYDEAVLAIREEPFDLDRVIGVLDKQRNASVGVQQAAQAAWLAEIAGMDARARAAYADRLQEVLERHSGGKREKGKLRETD
jgi:uncharacterized membrane protein